jgi:CRISPR-associated endonuclease Csn1
MLQKGERMTYRLGLDIGTNSIGWTAVTVDAHGQPNGILGQGVRIFSDGRNPKDGSSLAVQRRVPRGMRRRRDRYLDRRHDLMEALIALGLMPPDEAGRKGLETLDPYEFRAKAIHGPLTPHELGRALFHLNQRRGFKSNRKTDKDADNIKIQPRIDELKRRIDESGAKTLGEYLYKRRLKGKMVRARPEAGFYPDRALYEEEFDAIHNAQAAHQTLRDTQWDDLKDIIFYQRPLRPVDPGWCLLEDGERRAHLALPVAQEFRMVQEANNLRILVPGEPAKRLTAEQRDKVLKELRTKKELKLDGFIKLLKLPSGGHVNLLDENRKALKGDESAACLSHKDIFGKAWAAMPIAHRTEIVRTLIETEKLEEIERIARTQWGLDENAAKKLAATSLPEGYARLSERAIARLLPIMEDQGLNYAEAVAEVPEYGHHSDFRPDTALDALPYYGAILTRQVVGGDATKPKDDIVAHYGRIANPTVHIGLGQLRRVVNALVKARGKPEEIVVELARDLKMNKEEKDDERKKNRENESANRRREEQIRASGGVPSTHLLRKLRLWDEQQINAAHVCPFTGAAISFEMAIDDRTEIEHILPFWKTLDDSMANKALCLREVNRVKRDRSPFEAFQTPQQAGKYRCVYEEILFRAEALPPNKRWRFHEDAMERFANEEEFLVRQLNETKYLSRISRTYLAHLYNEKADGKLKVRAIPGKLTAMLRGKWGLNALLGDHNRVGGDADDRPARKNRDDHRHHAIDAFVIAMTDQRLLKAISDLNSEADRKRLIDAIPPPWDGFAPDALRPHLDRIVISHKPDHGTFGDKSKTTGALHNDTAYGLIGPGKKGNWKVVSRNALRGVTKKEELEGIRDAALRAALETLWDDVAKAGYKPGEFANRAEDDGVALGGRKMKVRRARMTEELNVVQIKDRKTGKPYKAYKPDGNAFADIYQLPNGRWTAIVVQRFDANQPDFDPAKFRPHPAAKKIMRLHIDDMVAFEDGPRRRILRVVKMSGQTITMADHLEGGALKARDADKNDIFKYVSKSASSLKDVGFRKVGVDEIGRLTDPGPRKPDAR